MRLLQKTEMERKNTTRRRYKETIGMRGYLGFFVWQQTGNQVDVFAFKSKGQVKLLSEFQQPGMKFTRVFLPNGGHVFMVEMTILEPKMRLTDLMIIECLIG